MWTQIESALVLLAPEAEPLVKSFRDRFDPAGGEGVPAHLTVLYPFLAPAEISEDVLADLRALFGAIAPIEFSLIETRRFPGVLYLAPHPAEPLRALIETVAARYPDTPPYGGIFSEVVPHLT